MSSLAAVQLAFVVTAVAAATSPDTSASMYEKLDKTAFPCDPRTVDQVISIYEGVMVGKEAHYAKQVQIRQKQYEHANQVYDSNPTQENLSLKRSAKYFLDLETGFWESSVTDKMDWQKKADCVHRHFKTPNLNYRSVKHLKPQDKRMGGGRGGR